jgi:hypothetical protein
MPGRRAQSGRELEIAAGEVIDYLFSTGRKGG